MKLQDAVDKIVRVNLPEEGRIQGRAVGKLMPKDDEGLYYVRTSDTPHGYCYLAFKESAVFEVYKQISGIIEIDLA